jgi:hypothetical protein
MVFGFLLVAYANERRFAVYRVGSIPFQQSQYSRTKAVFSQYSRTNAILIQLRDLDHGVQAIRTLDNAGWCWVGQH